MKRQVVKKDPLSGRTIWVYEDLGPSSVSKRPSIGAPKTTSHNWGGRKVRPAKGA